MHLATSRVWKHDFVRLLNTIKIAPVINRGKRTAEADYILDSKVTVSIM